jgi:hypothetical protein
VLKNAGNNHRVAAGTVTQAACHSVNATFAIAKMAVLQNSVCDFNLQVKI